MTDSPKGTSKRAPAGASVAAAVLHRQGLVWVQRRFGTGHLDGYWEFPGGKVEAGEHPRDAVRRELLEELGVRVSSAGLRFLLTQDFRYPDRTLRLHFFACRIDSGFEGPASGRWVEIGELKRLSFPPANGPLLQRLPNLLSSIS